MSENALKSVFIFTSPPEIHQKKVKRYCSWRSFETRIPISVIQIKCLWWLFVIDRHWRLIQHDLIYMNTMPTSYSTIVNKLYCQGGIKHGWIYLGSGIFWIKDSILGKQRLQKMEVYHLYGKFVLLGCKIYTNAMLKDNWKMPKSVEKVWLISHNFDGRIWVMSIGFHAEWPMTCCLPMRTTHAKHQLIRHLVENTAWKYDPSIRV